MGRTIHQNGETGRCTQRAYSLCKIRSIIDLGRRFRLPNPQLVFQFAKSNGRWMSPLRAPGLVRLFRVDQTERTTLSSTLGRVETNRADRMSTRDQRGLNSAITLCLTDETAFARCN